MGTSACIGYIDRKTNSINYCVAQYDGGLDHTGKILKKYYTKLSDIETLASFWEIRYLEKTLKETESQIYPDARRTRTFYSVDDWYTECKWGNYIYLWEDGEWHYYDRRKNQFVVF